MQQRNSNQEQDFINMIREHQQIIYKVCKLYRNSREDQEDLFQEIVFQLWRSFSSFKGAAKISSWMYRVALNTAMAAYRRSSLPVEYRERFPEHMHPAQEQPAAGREEQLFEALRRLDPSEKAVISLYLDDYSYKEIADITGLSENNVGVRLNRIKNKLRTLLKV